jgi:imidazole glycerol phosphate synthase subunit HisF
MQSSRKAAKQEVIGGTFTVASGRTEIGTMALVPQIVDVVSVPVIAAGGIMDGRGIAAAFMLGASDIQMGTAFVPCPETAVNPAYVARLGIMNQLVPLCLDSQTRTRVGMDIGSASCMVERLYVADRHHERSGVTMKLLRLLEGYGRKSRLRRSGRLLTLAV